MPRPLRIQGAELFRGQEQTRAMKKPMAGAIGREQLRTWEGQLIVAALRGITIFSEQRPLLIQKCFGISASIG
jgi:hypothetical protein